ncbi:MAG: peptide-methionine (R)-S-oxide reductase MsrB [Acidobacteria bacterium]|nr:peptide-methionine (R)-S-oxide reductase MsrB [Acidobacteriota bacterium]
MAGNTRKVKPGTVTIAEFDDAGKRLRTVTVEKIVKTDAEWKTQLSAEQFYVARQAGTEPAFTGATWNNHEDGIYRCVCCETALYSSKAKFESGTGWPSFWEPIAKENVGTSSDASFGMVRNEVFCTRCEGHLGHVFEDGPQPTGLRYCMNAAAMRFAKASK